MTRWKQTLLNHQKLSSLAQQYYNEHLQSRMLTMWRIKLRQYIRIVKQARVARRYLVMRKAWDKWVQTRRIKAAQSKTLQKYFNSESLYRHIKIFFCLTSVIQYGKWP